MASPKRELTRPELKALSGRLVVARDLFNVVRTFKTAAETWCRLAADFGNTATEGVPALVASSAFLTAAQRYVDAADAIKAVLPASLHPAFDEPTRLVTALVRHYEPNSWALAEVGALLGGLSMLNAATRDVEPLSLNDIAWSAAWSAFSFIEAFDTGRAKELQGLALHDVRRARDAISSSRESKHRDDDDRSRIKKNDADAVSGNRAKVETAEREWLAQQSPEVIVINEQLAAEGDVSWIRDREHFEKTGQLHKKDLRSGARNIGAISLTKRSRRYSR